MSFPQFGEIIEEKATPDFQEFGEIIEEEQPTLRKEVQRHSARTGSRILETVAGLPGDVMSLGEEIIKGGVSRLTGKPKEELKALEISRLPTSADIRDISEKVFGEIVTPQNKKEKFIDDVVSDAAALAIPVKGRIPFLRSIGTSIFGNLSEQAAKGLGFEEKGQAAAKMGAFFLSGLTGKGSLKKYWNNEYALAEKAIPERARLDANRLDRRLENLQRTLKKGGIETPSQKFVEKPLQEVRKIIQNGEMRVEDAIAAKKKINELRSGMFDEVKGKSGRKFARTKINEVAGALDEAVEKYGKENPEFYKHWNAANEAYGGFHQSTKASRWIRNYVKGAGKGAILIAESLFPKIVSSSLVGFTGLKGAELMSRINKNPTLRRYYSNLIKNSIQENSSAFGKNLKALEKELKKDDPEVLEKLRRQNNSKSQAY